MKYNLEKLDEKNVKLKYRRKMQNIGLTSLFELCWTNQA